VSLIEQAVEAAVPPLGIARRVWSWVTTTRCPCCWR
jgi:hypothetical protein